VASSRGTDSRELNADLEIAGLNPAAAPTPGEKCRKRIDTSENSYGIHGTVLKSRT
jgi:hypothetical protein